MHYGGFLMDGTKFDSSFDRRKPFTFELGVGQVIPGWDEGLQGVCKGDERHLVVPSHLAYGERGAGDVIPPGATLLFDVVIVDVEQVSYLYQRDQSHKNQSLLLFRIVNISFKLSFIRLQKKFATKTCPIA